MRRQRLIELTQRTLRRASDEEVMGMLETPPQGLTQGHVAIAAPSLGLLMRALERGVLSPDTRCITGTVPRMARYSCRSRSS